jgi:predicted nicotinamide N-methyase
VAWRRRLEARRAVRDRTATVPGAEQPYVLAAPADPDAVLDETDPGAAREGAWHMPYWATPWASGLFLAEVVLARAGEVRARRVLELGCGLGSTAVAVLQAQRGDGRFLAADVFAEALTYCQFNALRNAGRPCPTLLADWRLAEGREALVRAGPFDLVLAADVLYEPEDVAPLLDLVPRLLPPPGSLGAPGALWLAEPGRATSGRFVEAATALGWSRGVEEAERDWPAGGGHARVRVHFLRPRRPLRPGAGPPGHPTYAMGR